MLLETCQTTFRLQKVFWKILHLGIYPGEPGADWVINQIRSVIAFSEKPKAMITDHGPQFISAEFTRFTHNFGIESRKGKVGMPYSNGKIERFFGSLRTELLNLFPALSIRRIEKLLAEYRIYYNLYRPHQSLHSESPENVYNFGIDTTIYARPPKTCRTLPDKIKRLKFCKGSLTAYIAV